jgi:hypothetical protein
LTDDVGDLVILGVPFFMTHQVSIDWKKRRWLIRPYQDLTKRIEWKANNYDKSWKLRRYESKSIFVKMIKQRGVQPLLEEDPFATV